MQQYESYSFDLWLTLIRSNPAFKQARAQYLFEQHNPKRLLVSQIADIIRRVDLSCNHANEVCGRNISHREMYSMVLYQMLYTDHTAAVIDKLCDDVEQLFLTYPPQVYSDDTIQTLRTLKYDGRRILLLSNTGFIPGATISKWMQTTDFASIFNWRYYSDEIGYSKPNPKAFNELKYVGMGSLCHVGDNPVADYAGAIHAGFDAFLINSNDKTIKDLLL